MTEREEIHELLKALLSNPRFIKDKVTDKNAFRMAEALVLLQNKRDAQENLEAAETAALNFDVIGEPARGVWYVWHENLWRINPPVGSRVG